MQPYDKVIVELSTVSGTVGFLKVQKVTSSGFILSSTVGNLERSTYNWMIR
jgi:hypothetical protein